MRSFDAAAELGRLYALEIDAAHAYASAVAQVSHGPIRDELRLFGLEHQRHVLWLQEALVRLGRAVPDASPDVKGVVIGALTAPGRPLTLEDVIEGMRGNEQLTGSVYAKALAKPLPQGLRELVERLAAEERRHLDGLERMVSRRVWETSYASHP